MTQALLNNLINTTQQAFTDKSSVKDFVQSDFQNILDKQTDLQAKAESVKDTLGAMKKDVENTFQKLQDKISSTFKEISDESALDLTLAKNITDIATNENEAEKVQDDELSAELSNMEIPTENLNGDDLKNSTIDTTIQNLVQPIADVYKNQIVQIQEGEAENSEEELNVTLNGINLDKMLEDFGFNNTDDLPEIKPLKSEIAEETEGKTLEELVDEDTLRELNVESVETDTSSGEEESSDLMQNQTAEEQGIKASLQHADANFGELKSDSQSNVSLQATKPTGNSDVTPSKIIEQISKQLENMNTGSKVNIVLNPESLGKVSVQLINTKEGLSAQFTVATQEARNLIMKGLDGLKDTLLSQGVSVDNVTVKLNETQESEYNADWTEQEGSRGGNKEQDSRRGQKEDEQFEQMMSFAQNEEN